LKFSVFQAGVLSDIRNLPFRDQSLDGLWNLGVMEHFSADDQLLILREFQRVLKPGARMLLWWPPPYGLDHMILRWFGLFPDEPGRLNRQDVNVVVQATGFDVLSVDFPISDGFTELVLIAERPV
jgi:SAM-dependent methyltransferase